MVLTVHLCSAYNTMGILLQVKRRRSILAMHLFTARILYTMLNLYCAHFTNERT
jgi:hypothetical protein